MVELAVNIESIYHFQVSNENYRMLSQFEYNVEETPLRSARLSRPPPMTDVSFVKKVIKWGNIVTKTLLLCLLRRSPPTKMKASPSPSTKENRVLSRNKTFLMGQMRFPEMISAAAVTATTSTSDPHLLIVAILGWRNLTAKIIKYGIIIIFHFFNVILLLINHSFNFKSCRTNPRRP